MRSSRLRSCSRSQVSQDLFAQLATPLHFVDFLREPVVDEETGETLDAHPSYYEAAPGGLSEIRCSDTRDSASHAIPASLVSCSCLSSLIEISIRWRACVKDDMGVKPKRVLRVHWAAER